MLVKFLLRKLVIIVIRVEVFVRIVDKVTLSLSLAQSSHKHIRLGTLLYNTLADQFNVGHIFIVNIGELNGSNNNQSKKTITYRL